MGFLASTTDYRANPTAMNQADYTLALNQSINNPYLPDWAKSNQQNDQQTQLAQALSAQSRGEGPNLATEQMNQGLNTAMQQQAGAISSQKGINPALAARMAAEGGAKMQQGVASNAAQIRAQQQLGAQQQLAGVLQQQRQGNMGQAMGTAEAESRRMMGLGQLQQGQNQLQVQNNLGTQGINAGIEQSNTAGRNQALGAGIKAWGDSSAAFMGSMGGMMGGAAHGGEATVDFTDGGHVGGEARVAGDSPENDTVHAMLSPGEIVLPRTIAGDGDKAKAFVEALTKHHGQGGGYGRVIAAKRKAQNA